jgi:hypothetical protein
LNAGSRLVVVTLNRGAKLEAKGFFYKQGTTTPLRTLQGLSTFAAPPVLDKRGNLYIANTTTNGYVAVYNPGANIPTPEFFNTVGFPTRVAIGPGGERVVLWALHTGGNEITGYLKDVSQPTLTITKGLSDASDIAIDSNSLGNIAVFRPGKMTASRQITSGISVLFCNGFRCKR